MSRPKSLYARQDKKKMKRPEQIIQIGVAKELYKLEALCNQEDFFFFHVPNGGWRSGVEAGIFQAMGTRSGVSDLFITFPQYKRSHLSCHPDPFFPPRMSIIEYKAIKKKTHKISATDDQDAFGQLMLSYGFDWHLVGATDVEDATIQTLRIMRPHLRPGCRTASIIDQYIFSGGQRV